MGQYTQLRAGRVGLDIYADSLSMDYPNATDAARDTDAMGRVVTERRGGRTLIGAEVARQYRISDTDGRRPPSVRDLMAVEPVNYQGRNAQ